MSGRFDAAGAPLWAELAVLGAAACYASGSLYARGLRARGLAPIDLATGQVSAAALFLAPAALLVDRPWLLPLPGWSAFAALLAIGALSTALAYVVYFRILAGRRGDQCGAGDAARAGGGHPSRRRRSRRAPGVLACAWFCFDRCRACAHRRTPARRAPSQRDARACDGKVNFFQKGFDRAEWLPISRSPTATPLVGGFGWYWPYDRCLHLPL